MSTYIQGDTVWLRVNFYDRTGALYDPVSVSLKLFDSGRDQIGTTYTTAIVHVGTGIYECPVVLPARAGIVAEWAGVDSNGYTQITRAEIHPEWASDVDATAAALSDLITIHEAKAAAHTAGNISVADPGGKFTGATVEAVLAELEARIAALE